MNTNQIAEIALLVGEPARAAMLVALMDGRALTAGELAKIARIAPQTASGHLSRLVAAGLLEVERQGRHRYHRLSTPEVARLLEGMMRIASTKALRTPRPAEVGRGDSALRAARTCYDHVAGRLGVAISDCLIAKGVVEFDKGAGQVTKRGFRFLQGIGIDFSTGAPGLVRTSRPVCRPCLDWSERRYHIAGRLGAAICVHCLGKGWLRRKKGTRALDITPEGQYAMRDVFGVD